MIFFADDNEASSRYSIKSDVFCIVGLLMDTSVVFRLEQVLGVVKSNHDIPTDLPIKWNMKDTKLRKTYEEADEKKLYDKVVKESDQIRKECLKELEGLHCTVVGSSMRNLTNGRGDTIWSWCFTAILQRYGLLCNRDRGPHFFVLDWESKKRDLYCKEYGCAYSKGISTTQKPYFSGALKNKGSMPYLSFSVTIFNPALQMADFVVGCCADFLNWCYKGENEQRVRAFFPLITSCLNHSPSGQIIGWGLVVQPRDDRVIVAEKLEEAQKWR